MLSNVQRASVRAGASETARADLVKRRLRRYHHRFQGAVRLLAGRHARLADLAVSFPALLFALAAPRAGFDPARAVARTIEGAPLAELSAIVGIPLWLRKLAPEAFVRPIPFLPDGELFRRQVANHLPRSSRLAPIWLQALADAAGWGDETLAVWTAKELLRDPKSVKLEWLRLISLWAWYSARAETPGGRLIEKPWRPALRFSSAQEAAREWRTRVALHVNLGEGPIADMWLRPGCVGDYAFEPLGSAAAIAEEAARMKNCLSTYGYNLAHNGSRLWSVQEAGRHVATLQVSFRFGDPHLNVVQLKMLHNRPAPKEMWWAARRWLNMHDLFGLDIRRPDWGSVPLDRAAWISMWRPYWLAKRRIPHWLPMAPSRAALNEL